MTNVRTPPVDLRATAAELVGGNPRQMHEDEYVAVASRVQGVAGCRLLVFGTGRDSGWWLDVNAGGRTEFLEDDSAWLERTRREHPDAHVHLVSYGTRVVDWWRLLRADRQRDLGLFLPRPVVEAHWDVILVDGPRGHTPDSPGRMCAIGAAAQLAGASPPCAVFVHDIHRIVERVYCDVFLTPPRRVRRLHRLAEYRFDACARGGA